MSSELINVLSFFAALTLVVHAIVLIMLSTKRSIESRNKLEHIMDRNYSWWMLLILISLAFYFNRAGLSVMFGLVSFFALREFITMAPSRPADHRSLFWMFFVILPLQYYSIYKGWMVIFYILVPIFALIVLPFRSALSGDTNRFLERTSSLQWGLVISVYCVSHLPAILLLDIPDFNKNAELLLYFIAITQINEVIQHQVGLWFGKHKIATNVSKLRSWEGWFLGSVLSSILGVALTFMTPFSMQQSFVISLICTQLGFAGGIVMSAIKRSKGIQTFDELIPGHGGVLDWIDSILFSAPVFYYLISYFYLFPKF